MSFRKLSRLENVTDPLQRTTNLKYDDFDNLEKITYPPISDGDPRTEERFVYDPLDRIKKAYDRAARKTEYEYDPNRRWMTIKDPLQQITRIEFNERQQRTAVIDAKS